VLATFDEKQFNPEIIHNHALEFDKPRFQRRIQQFIETKLQEQKSKISGITRTSTNDLVS
jgi:hypothetical protein